jgi:hypothetical protein
VSTYNTIQMQLYNALLLVERMQAELGQFEFKAALDTSWQLKGELEWIREQANKELKEEQP